MKKQALYDATVKLVHEVGFASASVSKIAKEAGVSPSTLYVYHESKEDLLISTYVNIKMEVAEAMLEGFDENAPLHDILKQAWLNLFSYTKEHLEKYMFVEQFAGTPYIENVDRDAMMKVFEPFRIVLEKGMEQKVLKNVPMEFIGAFYFHPMAYLASPRHCGGECITDVDVDMAFAMVWDALKY